MMLRSLLRVWLKRLPYFVGALDQLNFLDQTKELSLLFKLYSWAAENPYGFQLTSIKFSKMALPIKEMPTVLKSVGRVLKMGAFSEAGQSLIDIATQPPKKLFQSQTDFRTAFEKWTAVRAQIANWYPSLSKAQLELMFQTAKEDFETHNRAWMTHEGLILIFLKLNGVKKYFLFWSCLKNTDIREIVLALQQIAKEGRLYEMLSQAIENQRVVLHYFGDGSTVPHIMTDWINWGISSRCEFVYTPVDAIHLGFHVAVSFNSRCAIYKLCWGYEGRWISREKGSWFNFTGPQPA